MKKATDLSRVLCRKYLLIKGFAKFIIRGRRFPERCKAARDGPYQLGFFRMNEPKDADLKKNFIERQSTIITGKKSRRD